MKELDEDEDERGGATEGAAVFTTLEGRGGVALAEDGVFGLGFDGGGVAVLDVRFTALVRLALNAAL